MQRDPRAFLWDVQQAADAITRFTADLDTAGYRADPPVLERRQSGCPPLQPWIDRSLHKTVARLIDASTIAQGAPQT